MPERTVTVTVNGTPRTATVEDRRTLAEFLREECGLTGTHLACEHGVCGACTVLLDGAAVRSCLLFAAQAEGAELTTIEGLSRDDGTLTPIQQAFADHHGLQCGFCTPGFIVSVTALLEANPNPTDEQIREGLSGNLCRCTGYQGIVEAVKAVAGRSRARAALELIDLDVEALPPVTDYTTALDSEERVHPDRERNLAGDMDLPVDDELRRIIDTAPHTVTETYVQNRYLAVPMETRGVIAWWNRRMDSFEIWVSTQSPHDV